MKTTVDFGIGQMRVPIIAARAVVAIFFFTLLAVQWILDYRNESWADYLKRLGLRSAAVRLPPSKSGTNRSAMSSDASPRTAPTATARSVKQGDHAAIASKTKPIEISQSRQIRNSQTSTESQTNPGSSLRPQTPHVERRRFETNGISVDLLSVGPDSAEGMGRLKKMVQGLIDGRFEDE